MDLTVKISKHRKTIVFDYAGEWKPRITHANYDSTTPMKMSNVDMIDDFTFYLSDFTDYNSMVSCGFSKESRAVMAEFFKAKDVHNNDPEKLLFVLQQLPTNKENVEKWKESGLSKRFSNVMQNTMMPMIKDSILNHYVRIKDWFHQGKDEKRPVINWEQKLKSKKHLIINLSEFKSGQTNELRARSWVGLIFKQWREHLRYVKPFIVIEEASRVCPNTGNTPDYEMPSSVYHLSHLASVGPKEGVAVMYIAQSINQLPVSITQYVHATLVGIQPRTAPEWLQKISRMLRFNYPYYREFMYVEEGKKPWENKRFVPMTPPCCIL